MFKRKFLASLYSSITSVVITFFFLSFIATEYVFSNVFPFLFTGYSLGNFVGAFFLALPFSLLFEWLTNKIADTTLRKPSYIGAHFLLCLWALWNSHYVIAFIFSILVTSTFLYFDHLFQKPTFWNSYQRTHWIILGVFALVWIICFSLYLDTPYIPAMNS
ncbi:hypothetical protein [Risungbinella massiliensis]|uniref:hypothetical protein n=1 Tax=Risungbinella massiliensis TaxID=1329796 RepID=UPI0005CC1BFB|nr:hypothetical protein [Risungbinella massiliensis]